MKIAGGNKLIKKKLNGILRHVPKVSTGIDFMGKLMIRE